MAWTQPTTQSLGDLIDTGDWNDDVINNIIYLAGLLEPQTLTNQSGGALAAGDVVVVDGSNDNSVTTTTSQADTGVIGVSAEAIGSGATGRISTRGVVTVNVQGNVTRGNFLHTSTTAKRAEDAGTAKSSATFGVALTAYTGGGAGTVTALIFPAGTGNQIPANVVLYTSDGSAPTGFSEYTGARGRFIVGLPSGGTNEGTVASALSDLASLSHTHTLSTTPAHSHTYSGVEDGVGGHNRALLSSNAQSHTPSTSSVGSASPSTSSDAGVPYIQLMTISKD